MSDKSVNVSGGQLPLRDGGGLEPDQQGRLFIASAGGFAFHPLVDGGRPCVGYVRFTGAGTVDGNTITINGRVYEFDTGGVITGDVLVDISGGGSAAQSATAFLLALNADTGRSVNGANMLGTTEGVFLVDAANPLVGANYTLAVSGANLTRSGAALTGGSAPASRLATALSHTITADEITFRNLSPTDNLWPLGAIGSASTPMVVGVLVRDSGGSLYSNANLTVTVTQSNPATGYWEVVLGDPDSILSANDVVTLIVAV